MTTAALREELAARGVTDEVRVRLAEALTRAQKIDHELHADQCPEGGHRFTCPRCGGLIAWMPGLRAVHRGVAVVTPCAQMIRVLVAEGAATADQRAWLAGQEGTSRG